MDVTGTPEFHYSDALVNTSGNIANGSQTSNGLERFFFTVYSLFFYFVIFKRGINLP